MSMRGLDSDCCASFSASATIALRSGMSFHNVSPIVTTLMLSATARIRPMTSCQSCVQRLYQPDTRSMPVSNHVSIAARRRSTLPAASSASTRSTVASSCECCAAAVCSPADIRAGQRLLHRLDDGEELGGGRSRGRDERGETREIATHGVADLGGRHPGRQVATVVASAAAGAGLPARSAVAMSPSARSASLSRACGCCSTSSSVSAKTCLGMYDGPVIESDVSREPDTGGPRLLIIGWS